MQIWMPAVHMVERKGRGTREKDVWETFGLVCILTMINGFTEMAWPGSLDTQWHCPGPSVHNSMRC